MGHSNGGCLETQKTILTRTIANGGSILATTITKKLFFLVDKTQRIARQTGLAEEEKVADIVEGLLGIKWCVERGRGPPEITDIDQCLFADIRLTLDDIACFWSTVAYAIYHKNLVWQWFESTHAK